MEVKLECDCGQTYAFDVEPVGGLMPVAVGCPSCGADGTSAANAHIARTLAAAEPPKPAAPRMSMQRAHAAPPAVPAATPASIPVPPPPTAAAAQRQVGVTQAAPAKPAGSDMPNLPMGILGAFLGAAIGAGLAYWFTASTGIRFPFIGLAIGLLTALGGRLLCRGTDQRLGYAAGAFAFLSVGGYLAASEMLSVFSIVSLLVSVWVAYNRASG